MRKRRFMLVLALAHSLLTGNSAILAQKQTRDRLVIDNRSDSVVEISAWAYSGRFWEWRKIATLNSKRWIALYDVHDNKRFRAVGKASEQFHVVRLRDDTTYNGRQDIWWVK